MSNKGLKLLYFDLKDEIYMILKMYTHKFINYYKISPQ